MNNKDYSDPYVKWYYKNLRKTNLIRKILGITFATVAVLSAVFYLVTEHNNVALIISCVFTALLVIDIMVVGILGFIRAMREEDDKSIKESLWLLGVLAVIIIAMVTSYKSGVRIGQQRAEAQGYNQGYEDGYSDGLQEG